MCPESKTNIVVTGGTGQIGLQVVYQLLSDIRERRCALESISCIVRASSSELAFQRIYAALADRAEGFQALDRDFVRSTLKAYAGDVVLPQFGLKTAEFEELLATTGLVYHAAAHVSWSRPYELLRAANVVGTQQVIDFCLASAAKLVNISTVAVAASVGDLEGVTIGDLELVSERGGYVSTKLLAERFVTQAAWTRGLQAVNIRPAMITGHSRSGKSNRTDFVPSFLLGALRMGAVLDDPVQLQDMVPVDHAGLFIARTGLSERAWPAASPLVFAIADNQPLSFSRIGELVTQWAASRRPDQPVAALRYPRFREAVLANPVDNPLYGFLHSVFQESCFQAGSRVPLCSPTSTLFFQQVAPECPVVNKDELIPRYLDALV